MTLERFQYKITEGGTGRAIARLKVLVTNSKSVHIRMYSSNRVKICFFFQKFGNCKWKNRCKFSHEIGNRRDRNYFPRQRNNYRNNNNNRERRYDNRRYPADRRDYNNNNSSNYNNYQSQNNRDRRQNRDDRFTRYRNHDNNDRDRGRRRTNYRVINEEEENEMFGTNGTRDTRDTKEKEEKEEEVRKKEEKETKTKINPKERVNNELKMLNKTKEEGYTVIATLEKRMKYVNTKDGIIAKTLKDIQQTIAKNAHQEFLDYSINNLIERIRGFLDNLNEFNRRSEGEEAMNYTANVGQFEYFYQDAHFFRLESFVRRNSSNEDVEVVSYDTDFTIKILRRLNTLQPESGKGNEQQEIANDTKGGGDNNNNNNENQNDDENLTESSSSNEENQNQNQKSSRESDCDADSSGSDEDIREDLETQNNNKNKNNNDNDDSSSVRYYKIYSKSKNRELSKNKKKRNQKNQKNSNNNNNNNETYYSGSTDSDSDNNNNNNDQKEGEDLRKKKEPFIRFKKRTVQEY